MKYIIRIFAITCATLLLRLPAFASHTTGGAIYYTHLHDDVYRVTLELYYECGTTPVNLDTLAMQSMPAIFIVDTLDFTHIRYYDTLSLMPDMINGRTEVLKPCFTEHTVCTDPTSVIPGIMRYTFSAEYTVKRNAGMLWFVFEGQNGGNATMVSGRISSITNIDAHAELIWLAAGLLCGDTNSSALAHNQIQPFYCLNNGNMYTPAFTDSDGDSIDVAMVQPLGSGGSSYPSPSIADTLPYKAPYSPATPFAVAPGTFSFDSKTGNMAFMPNQQQRALVDYCINEYRNGQWVGSSMMDLIILVTTCKDTCTVDTIANSSIKIYPSPADLQIEIDMDQRPYDQVTVFNMLGQRVMSMPLYARANYIETDRWPDGIYLLQITGRTGKKLEKILVQH